MKRIKYVLTIRFLIPFKILSLLVIKTESAGICSPVQTLCIPQRIFSHCRKRWSEWGGHPSASATVASRPPQSFPYLRRGAVFKTNIATLILWTVVYTDVITNVFYKLSRTIALEVILENNWELSITLLKIPGFLFENLVWKDGHENGNFATEKSKMLKWKGVCK